VTEDDMKKFIWHMENPKEKYSPSFKQITQYQVQRVLALRVLDIDRQFWEKKGWDKQVYYFDCRIGPIKRLWGWVFYTFMKSRIKPNSR
jgi:hypothetical protein